MHRACVFQTQAPAENRTDAKRVADPMIAMDQFTELSEQQQGCRGGRHGGKEDLFLGNQSPLLGATFHLFDQRLRIEYAIKQKAGNILLGLEGGTKLELRRADLNSIARQPEANIDAAALGVNLGF